ncbi:MAG: hypothetical protein ACSLFR_01200 [Solirubrobacteraceae bacterium]
MHSRAARAARGWIAAAFATFVAAFSHVAAGGNDPTAFGVIASLVLSGAACTLLAGRTLSLGRLAASVAVSQVLFHGLFSTLGTPAAVGHSHETVPLDATTAAPHTDMLLAHLAAGLVTLVALRYGERAFWTLIELARLIVTRLVVAIAALDLSPRTPLTATPAPAPARDLAVLLSTMRYRGPPAMNGAR